MQVCVQLRYPHVVLQSTAAPVAGHGMACICASKPAAASARERIVEDLLAERGIARDAVEDLLGHGPELLLGRWRLRRIGLRAITMSFRGAGESRP